MPVVTITRDPKGYIATRYGTKTAFSMVNESYGFLRFSKSWNVTVGYQAKKLKGELPMLPFTVSREEGWFGQGHYSSWSYGTPKSTTYFVDGIPTGEWSAGAVTAPVASLAQRNAVQAKAMAKALSDLKNQKVNLAQALAERRRTADLIASNIARMIAAFQALKRRDLEEALRHLGAGAPTRRRRRRINAIWRSGRQSSEREFQNASSVWLEIQYGWRPLLVDIYESAKLIQKAQDQSPRKAKQSSTAQFNSREVLKPSPAPLDKVYRIVNENIMIRGTVTLWYSTPNVPRTLSQLGFTNPAYLAWELTPFSFVVDWFIPIGNALNSLDATLGLSFEKGCYSEKIVTSRRTTGTGRNTIYNENIGYSTNYMTLHRFQRTVLTNFPSVVFPDFKNPFSIEHALNAMALLVQVFGGR